VIDRLTQENELFGSLLQTEGAQQAFAAFLKNRLPWKNMAIQLAAPPSLHSERKCRDWTEQPSPIAVAIFKCSCPSRALAGRLSPWTWIFPYWHILG